MHCSRLLLVEDNELAAMALTAAFGERAIEVSVVHNGRESIGKLIHCRAEAMIIDLTLPDIDGVTVAEIVRRNWPELPIVLTSGHREPASARALLRDGRTIFLQKPYELDEVIAAIEARLDGDVLLPLPEFPMQHAEHTRRPI